jgi:hypothetical protein
MTIPEDSGNHGGDEAEQQVEQQTEQKEFIGFLEDEKFTFKTEEDLNKFISARDKRKEKWQEKDNILQNFEEEKRKALKQAEEERRRAQMLEAAKNEDMAKLEQQISEPYQRKIQQLQKQMVRDAIKTNLLSDDGFLRGKVDDAVDLILIRNQYGIDEDTGTIKFGERYIEDVLSEFKNKSDHFYIPQKPQNKNSEVGISQSTESKKKKADLSKITKLMMPNKK